MPALVLMLTDVEHIEIDYVPWGPVVGAAVLSLCRFSEMSFLKCLIPLLLKNVFQCSTS